MQDSEFNDDVDEIVEQLENELDEVDEDLDIEFSGGILTIGFPNGSSVVVSRQIANHEIWIAAKSGGFHLGRKDKDWFCATTGETLSTLVSRVVTEQVGRAINLLAD